MSKRPASERSQKKILPPLNEVFSRQKEKPYQNLRTFLIADKKYEKYLEKVGEAMCQYDLLNGINFTAVVTGTSINDFRNYDINALTDMVYFIKDKEYAEGLAVTYSKADKSLNGINLINGELFYDKILEENSLMYYKNDKTVKDSH